MTKQRNRLLSLVPIGEKIVKIRIRHFGISVWIHGQDIRKKVALVNTYQGSLWDIKMNQKTAQKEVKPLRFRSSIN